MRKLLFLLSAWFAFASCRAESEVPTLVELPHRVVHDEMLFLRDKDDRRCSVWTDDPAKVPGLLAGFNPGFDDLLLKKGERSEEASSFAPSVQTEASLIKGRNRRTNFQAKGLLTTSGTHCDHRVNNQSKFQISDKSVSNLELHCSFRGLLFRLRAHA